MVKDAGADVALILAIEDYTALPDVTGAAANARAWAAYLKARGVGTVKLMVNGDVTREQVLGGNGITGAAEQVRARLKDGGTVWLVYVGHGAPGDGSGALVGWDAQRTAASVTSRSIGQDELLRALGRDDGVPIVAVVDACFSGRTGAGELAPGVQPVRPVESTRTVRDETTLLVAARSDQYAGSMPGLGRPAFSWLALGALRGWADGDDDGAVTGAELVDWSANQLLEAVNDRAQTPEVFGDRARVLGRGRERAPELVVVAVAPVVTLRGASGELSSDDDLLADVASITAKLKEVESLKKQLAEARERELAAGVARIQAQAKETWGKLAPLRELGGPDAEAKVRAYVAKYGAIKAEYVDAEASWSRIAAVAEVKEAETWLVRASGTTSGAGSTASGVSTTVIDTMMRSNKAVKICFFNERNESGSLPSEVRVKLTIEPSGRVPSATVNSGKKAPRTAFDGCLSAAVQAISFPPFTGEPVTLTYPFLL